MTDFNRLNGPQRKILREVLTSVFRRSRDLDVFLDEHDFGSLEDLVAPNRFSYQVFDLIRELSRHGRLDNLIEHARRDFPENPDLVELEQRLHFADAEAEQQRVVSAIGLERMVRDAGYSDLNLWAGRLLAAGRRVCRISYPVAAGLVRGTGFLVGEDRVLTNYHVVEKVLDGRAEAATVRLGFDYAETAEGLEAGETYSLAQDWLVASSPYGTADTTVDAGLPAEDELDFALVRLDRAAGATAGAAGVRGWVELPAVAAAERPDGIVFVLQHPTGQPLKQSIGVLLESASPVRLRYDADTRGGSSGALVLDQHLVPLALHHAGDPDAEIKARYNQGIPLTRIRDALATAAAASEETE